MQYLFCELPLEIIVALGASVDFTGMGSAVRG